MDGSTQWAVAAREVAIITHFTFLISNNSNIKNLLSHGCNWSAKIVQFACWQTIHESFVNFSLVEHQCDGSGSEGFVSIFSSL